MMLRRAVIVASFGAALAARPAYACTCMQSGPACEEFWKVDAVFVGRVLAIDATTADDERSVPQRKRLVHFEVIEPYRNAAPLQEDVLTGMGGGDCGYDFKVDETYIVYAYRSGGRLTTGICSRTETIGKASIDLLYARTLSNRTDAGAIVSGIVRNRDLKSADGNANGRPPVAGVNVRLTCAAGSYHRITGRDGAFAFDGLPAGTCTLEATPPAGMYSLGPPRESIAIGDGRACAQKDLWFGFDGRVSGRFVDADRNPIAGVTIDLVTFAARPDPDGLSAVTNDDGAYEIAHVPPGTYLVGANLRTEFDRKPIAAPLYLPGVAVLGDAARIALGGGERVDAGDLIAPAERTFIHVMGRVLMADGAPAAGAKVTANSEGNRTFAGPVVADADGMFVIALPAGVRVWLSAWLPRPTARESWAGVGGKSDLFTATVSTPLVPITVR